jgi:8-oxo-dGTP pyrophosphatase MutT (NUDIX family)
VTDWTLERFRQLADRGLRRDAPLLGDTTGQPRSDDDDQHELFQRPDEASLTPAAVLVPVVDRPGGATVLLTQRSAGLRTHSAQIAFPGGRIDADDASPLEAALREANEEIGLDRRHVAPVGFLDAYLTGTGYRIVPVVAVVDPGFTLRLNPHEVEEAFETPLSFLMNPANHARHGRQWQGRYRSYHAMPYGERYIWGATAGILRNLHDRLAGVATAATSEAAGERV